MKEISYVLQVFAVALMLGASLVGSYAMQHGHPLLALINFALVAVNAFAFFWQDSIRRALR